MADKDKKKLKVILKLPPKSSSSQLKSPTARGAAVISAAAAPGVSAAAEGGGVVFPSGAGAGAAAAAAVVGSKNISGLFAFPTPPSSSSTISSSGAPFVSASQFVPSSAGFFGGGGLGARGGPASSQDNHLSSSAHFGSSGSGGAGSRGGVGGGAAALQDHHQSSSGHFSALTSGGVGGRGGGRPGGGGGGSQDLHHHHHHHHQQQQQQQQQHHHRSSNSSRNLHSQSRHGFAPAAAGAGLSGAAFNTGASSFSSVRSSNSSSGPSPSSSAPAGAAASGSLFVSAPPPSLMGAPTPPKKRKFKTVEHAGALGVGAVVVGGAGSGAGFGAGPGPGRDAGGGAGKTAKGGGGRLEGGVGGTGGVKVEGGVGGTAVGGGGKTALPASVAFPVKKSHKKQVKPSIQTDGQQAHPFAGVILPPKATSEPLSKTMLEGVLEKLQKKDTYGVFAEPVDAIQVPDYYDIIKEPMDFGTMRKKIKRGAYTTVEQFEGDIYLICSNAMRYNGPDTIYYKQARAIREMARKSLEGIRAQLAGEIRKPVSHKKKQSPTKKSHAKKPPLSKVRLDGTGSDFASGATLAGDGEHRGWSNSTVDTGKAKKGMSMEKLVGLGEDSQGAWAEQPVVKENKADMQEEPTGAAALKPMGPKDGRRPLTTEEYHRNTYKQRQLPAHGQGPPLAAVGGESRLLVPVGNQGEHAYAKSLAQFGSVLGPRAWCFVAKKLELLKAPAGLLGKTNPSPAGEAKVPKSSQAAASSTDSRPHVGTPSVVGTAGEVLSSPSGPSHSGPVADSTPSRPSGVPQTPQVVDSAPNCPSVLPHIGQGVNSTPSFPSGASLIGQGVVSTLSHPSGTVHVAEAGASTPNHTSGASQVGEAVVSSHNRPSGGASRDGQAEVPTPNFPSGGQSHFGHGHAIVSTTPNRPSGVSQGSMSAGGPSHVGQALGQSLSSSGAPHIGQPSSIYPVGGVSQGAVSAGGPSHVGQAVGQSLSSSGASHIGQPSSIYPMGGAIGSIEQTSGKDLQVGGPQGVGPFETQQGSGNGRLEGAARSDSLVHKQILGLDSDVASEENRSIGRLGWTQGSAVSAVDQGVQGLALGATSKGSSQAWSTVPLKHGSSGYSYVPVASSGGRDEASAQAWAQARVMSLAHPAESKRNLVPGVQAFHSQGSQVKSPANLPQILQQPSIYGEYNSLARLPPRQSTGLPMSSGPISQAQEHRAEASASKSGVAEQKGSLNLHSQGSNRPAPLQQNSSQQRTMPPDLNVALLSPSALQSPPPQGSTPTGGHHPDLKLQL